MADWDVEGFEHLTRWVQDGAISRRQLVDLGAGPADLRRMLRRRELTVQHPGVYVTHTGPLTQAQRAWCAVLQHAPAALCLESALPHVQHHGPIQVAVALSRRITQVPGVHARRMADFEERLEPLSSPSRIRLEHAAIDVAASRSDTAARFQVLAEACGSRRTDPVAIAEALRSRTRTPHGAELARLLDDLAAGACSVLERQYLLLERSHHLPTARRQVAARPADRQYYRDVSYDEFDVVVELDGRPFHDNARARDLDHQRDLSPDPGLGLRLVSPSGTRCRPKVLTRDYPPTRTRSRLPACSSTSSSTPAPTSPPTAPASWWAPASRACSRSRGRTTCSCRWRRPPRSSRPT